MAKAHIGRDIGDKLRQIAALKGMSQGQVASNAHISQPTVSALFNGGTFDPPISTLLKVARVLSVSIDELVGLKPLTMPEPVAPDTSPDQLQARVHMLERNLQEMRMEMRRELREIVQRQKADLEGERAAPRKRAKPA